MNADLAMRTIEALEPYARRLLETAAERNEAYRDKWFLAISQARLVVRACDAPERERTGQMRLRL